MKNILIIAAVAFAAWYILKNKSAVASAAGPLLTGVTGGGFFSSAGTSATSASTTSASTTSASGRRTTGTSGSTSGTGTGGDGGQVSGDSGQVSGSGGQMVATASFSKITNRRILR